MPVTILAEDKLALFKSYCDEYPELVRESLLVFKTCILLVNKQMFPYLEATLDECLEWFQTKV